MEDYNAIYSPAQLMEELGFRWNSPLISIRCKQQNINNLQVVGLELLVPPQLVGLLTRRERFKDLTDKEQHARLHQALMNCFAR